MKSIFIAIRAELNNAGPKAIVEYSTILKVAKTICYYKGIEKVSKNTVYMYLRVLRNLGYITKVDACTIRVNRLIPDNKRLEDFRRDYKRMCNLRAKKPRAK